MPKKKNNNVIEQPAAVTAKTATDHPTGKLEPGDMPSLFSLVDSPAPSLGHGQLFYSYRIKDLKIELERIEALEPQNGYAVEKGSLREQIRLIELLNESPDGLRFLIGEFEQENALRWELIYLLAKQGNEKAFKAFNRKIHEDFWHLKRMALDGHEGALRSLATLAIEATELVNRFAAKKPEVFESVASEVRYWPFLKSLHKSLNPVPEEEEGKLMEEIKLGKNTHQNLSPENRYDLGIATNRIAQRLLDYVRSVRRFAKYQYRNIDKNIPVISPEDSFSRSIAEMTADWPEEMRNRMSDEEKWELIKPELIKQHWRQRYAARESALKAELKKIAPTLLKGGKSLLEQAMDLPEVMRNEKDRKKWWKLAKRCLLRSYPALDPASEADVNDIALLCCNCPRW